MSLRADAVLFDKDGTLFSFDESWSAWARLFLDRMAGGDEARASRLAAAIGYDRSTGTFLPSSVAIAGTPEEVAALCAPVLGRAPEPLVDEINAAAAEAPMNEAVPLAPLLDRLRGAGLVLGVATNDAETPARAHLAAVVDRFDFIAGSDSGWTPKPDPAMCRAFAGAVGVAPHRVVMVGDSLHDLRAGRAAGMQTVGVLTGPADESRITKHADAVLRDIGQLPGWLGL
ncbi:HAD family hydrolase [Maritimibacter sp. UBA3975]|uniref:HAD family hydrolase n=1 Tax=Maritimibacter sp. UBA3975 TaxID=1946833 RepID=UPI0025C0F12B|nr:HAD family hydrolase [Maritimibacter sp. UBA3975]|tara:strand:+ start:3237 stop:3923 length:687 start_codon:yes stop_codon:yes gene_type:complete